MANVDVWCPFCEQIDFMKKHGDGHGVASVTVIGLVNVSSHSIIPIALTYLKNR